MGFFRTLIAAVILAVISYFLAESVTIGSMGIYSGLLALIAVGLFGLIWRQEAGNDSDSIGGATIGIAIFAFLAAFVLSDNTLVGHEKMTAILLSFIAVGFIGLAIIKKKR